MTERAGGELPRARRWQWRGFLERWGALVALIAVMCFSAWTSDAFLKAQNLLNILRQVSFVGIIAVGMTFVIILGGIDLSVGSMVAMLGGLAVWTFNKLIEAGWSEGGAYAAAAGVMLIGGPLVGLANGLLVTKGRIAPFIATLGGMAAYRSVSLAIADGGEFRPAKREVFGAAGSKGLPLPGFVSDVLNWMTWQFNNAIHAIKSLFVSVEPLTRDEAGSLTVSFAIIAFLLVACVGHVLLKSTRYGRYVYAIGCNERAAVYSAVNVDKIKALTYVLIGATCGVSTVLLSSRMNSVSSAQTGAFYELDAIAAVVIGGTSMSGGRGSVWGTVIGVVLLGVIGNMLNLIGVGAYYQGLVKGVIIVGAVLLQRGAKRI